MPRPLRYALRVREVMPGFVERTSVYVQRTRAHRARDLSGISVRPSPRQTGTRRSQARSRAPPSALRAPPPRYAGGGRALAFRSWSSSPFTAPSIAGDGGGKARMSERRDARVRAGPPAPRSAGHLACAAREVRCRGRRLLVTFLRCWRKV